MNKGQHEKKQRQGNNRRTLLIIGIGVLALALVISTILLTGTKIPKELQGKWQYEQDTVYEFQKNGNGTLYIQDDISYPFKCSVEDDILKLDFADDNITDCTYTYTIDAEVLTITGGEGTALLGKSYTLTRIQEE